MHHLAEHLCEKPELDVLVNMFHAAPGDSIINTIRNGIKDTEQNVVVWSRNDAGTVDLLQIWSAGDARAKRMPATPSWNRLSTQVRRTNTARKQ